MEVPGFTSSSLFSKKKKKKSEHVLANKIMINIKSLIIINIMFKRIQNFDPVVRADYF